MCFRSKRRIQKAAFRCATSATLNSFIHSCTFSFFVFLLFFFLPCWVLDVCDGNNLLHELCYIFSALLTADVSSLRASLQFHYSYSFFFFFAPPSLLSGVLLHYMSTLLLPPSRFVARLMTRRHGDTIFDFADIFVC